jgi:hypothetical protein
MDEDHFVLHPTAAPVSRSIARGVRGTLHLALAISPDASSMSEHVLNDPGFPKPRQAGPERFAWGGLRPTNATREAATVAAAASPNEGSLKSCLAPVHPAFAPQPLSYRIERRPTLAGRGCCLLGSRDIARPCAGCASGKTFRESPDLKRRRSHRTKFDFHQTRYGITSAEHTRRFASSKWVRNVPVTARYALRQIVPGARCYLGYFMKTTALLISLATALALVSSHAVAKGGGGRSGGSHYSSSGGSHSVRGHTTRQGTYVPPHRATNPDSTKRNNWSHKGNLNPYTAKPGGKND